MAKKPVSSSSNSARGEGHAVTKSGNMVYVAIDPSSVVKYVRAGNDLLIHQDNGKVIRIRGFFTAQDTQKLELVYKYDGSEWPVKAIQSTIPLDDETGAEVAFTVAEERSESDNATLLALAALGAAAIGIGTGGSSGGSGGGNGGGGTPEKPAPKSPDLTTKANADGTVTASGLAAAGSSVTVTFPDGSSRVVVAGADGKFSTTSLKPQETGNVTAIVTDANGKSSLPKVVEYIDKVAPGKPDGLSYTDEVGPITGKIAEKGVTDDARPTLSGKAEPNSTITIRDGTTVIGTTKADAQGNWTFRPTTALAEGEHKITFTATDKAKNESAPSAEFVFTVDTVAPPVPAVKTVFDNEKENGGSVALTSGGWTNDATPEFTGEGAEAGTTIYFYDNGNEIGKTVVGTDGKWKFTPAVNLQDGKHSVTMKAVDKAGNTSAASTAFELNVDTVAPNAPSIAQIMDDVGSVTGIIANGKTTDDTKPTLSGSGAEAGSIVKIYDGTTLIGQTTANANGTWSFTPETALTEGTHVFTVTATDKAGNEGASSTPWTIEVDVTPPDAAFVPVIINASDDVQPNVGTVAHEGFTNDTTPRLNGKGAEPSGFIRIYEGTTLLGQVQADENGNWSFDVPARSEGSHSFVAKTVDAAGNEGSSSDPFTLTVDTTAPVASDAVIIEVKDSAEPHTGNVVHGGLTNDARPVVSGTAVDGITLVRIYDGTTLLGEVEVTGGLWSFTPESDLLNGAHNFRIKAVDAAGNEGPYSPIWSVTVDTLAPNAPVIAQIVDDTGSIKGNVVDGKTTDAVRPKLSGGSAEAGSTVKIYDKGVLIGETTANANGTWSFTPTEDLVEGEHVFTVTSTDKAGNEGVPSSSWTITVDTTAPELPVISQVFDTTGDELTAGMVSGERRPTLSGEAEAGSVVTIYDNGKKIGTVVAEDDGTWSFELKSNLAQGAHDFTVKATDAAGNVSEASDGFGFTVDSIAPALPEITAITDDVGSITGAIKANGITDDARPVLTGKAEAGSIVTIYDFGEAIGTVTADATGAWTFTPDADLTDGGHSFSVSATDAAGNVSPASKAFVITVDTVAPDAPQFTTGYDAVGPVIGEFNSGAIINDGRPKLSGSGAEPNSKVTIYQDGVAVATITADAGGQWNWKSDAALSDATYVFTATVTDTAGNVSAPSTGFTVSVDTVAPAAPMIEAITDNVAPIEGNVDKGGFTNDTTPTLSGSGAEANGTVRIYDGATLLGEVKADADGKWSFTPENALGSGVHSFTVVGVDAAGNVSVRSDAYSVTVDTLAPNAPAITQVLDDVGSVQGAVASGKTTDDTKPTLSGNGAEGGSIVKIYDNGVLIGQTTANASGTWAFTPDTDLIEGAHSFTVTATDAAGNESSASMPWVVVVDITPPDASFKPVISSASDDVLPVTGEVLNNGFTNDTNPRLNGTGAEPSGFIRIYEGTTLLGQVQADENGNWSFDVPTRPDGSHSFVAKTVDAAGNEGSSSDAFTLTIDTKAPTASDAVITQVLDAAEPHTGTIEHNGLTNDARPVISGTAIDGVTVVRIYDGTTLLGEVEVNGGTWSFTPDSDLSNGVHNFRIKAVDAAGNEGPYSPTWSVTVDTTAPNAPSITAVTDDQGDLQGNVGDGKTTDDRRPTLSGGSAEAGSTVKIYDKGVLIGETTANANGTWSFTPTTDLVEGSHVFTVTATDKAGNEGVPSASFSVVVDTVAPEQPSIVKIVNAAGEELTADMITSERRPILSGEAEAGSVVTIYDNGKKIGTVVAEDDGTWSFELKSNLAQGAHDFTVKATDAAGNVSEASDGFGFTVDSIAPALPEITAITDDVGSITGSIKANGVTDDARPVLAGKAEAGSLVTIYDFGEAIGTVTADATGAWTFTPDADLTDGGHSFSVSATDAAGNVSPASKAFVITVDTVAPDAPQFTTGYDAVGPVIGEFNSGAIINDGRPKLSGSGAEPNAKVTIYQDGVAVATITADAGGQWNWKSDAALSDATYVFTATVTDTAGNVSAPSTGFTVSVDTVAPAAPMIEAITDNVAPIEGNVDKGGFTNDTTPTLSGSGAEANGTVRIYDGATLLGEVKADADGKWSFTPENALGSGVHSFTVVGVDAAGNVSVRSDAYSVTVDTLAPNAPAITQVLDDVGSVQGAVASGKTTDDTKPTLSGNGAEGGSIVKIYDNGVLIGQTTANASGTWAFTPDTDLIEGAHSFTVTATDAAGNESSASMPWVVVVDITPPDASFKPVISSASDDVLPVTGEVFNNGFTNDTNPRLNGTGAEPSGFIRIYEGTTLLGQVQADENGNWSFDVPTRPDGSHSFVAKTVDAAGNEGSSSDAFTLTIDTKAPTASDAVITQVLDAAEPHTGNIEHNGLTNDARPVISGTAIDGVTLVRIYDGTTLLGEVEVNGGTWSFTPDSDLSNGVHNFRIKAVDAAGNEGPYSPTWSVTVDTTAPNAPSITAVTDDQGDLQGNVGDGKTTDDRRPTLSGGSAEAGSTVKIYDKGVLIGETTANANGTWSFTPTTDLAEGSHVFTVTATDKAGNEGVPSASFSVVVDTVAPEQPSIVKIVNAAGEELTADMITSERRPILSGEAEAGSVVTIYDNGKKIGTVVAEDDGTWSFELKSNLAQGAHDFTVKATDAAGNVSEASDGFGFTVDSIAPALPEITAITDDVGSITGAIKANGITDDARPVLTGKAEAGSIVTIYDFGEAIGTVTADATGAWTFTPDADLTDGGHSFSVSATDAAGNVSPASKAFVITVDTVAPDAPQFTTGYDAVGPVIGEFNSGAIINDGRPKLSGSGAEPNAKVTIYQDGVAVATITADAGGQWNWKSDAALSDATYVFTATVTDTAGNVSAPSTGFTVSVDTVAPAAPMIEAITDNVAPIEGNVDKGGFTNDTTPTLSGSGAEANGTVRIYDGATLLGEVKADADGKWSFTPENALGSGVHSFTVVGVDAAGNVSVRSDAYSVTVDTLAPNAPAITQVLDDVGSVQGAVASGKTTDDTKPTLSGNGAEGGSIVKIYDNGVLIGQTTANASGTWAFTPDTDLIEGAHSFTVTATDAAGNESSASMPWVVVVDITPPDASFKPKILNASDDVLPNTGLLQNGEFTNDTTPRLNGDGAEANGLIRIYSEGKLLGTVQADKDGNWSFDVPTLSEGKHDFIATTVDAAGNEGTSSEVFSLTVDTKAPVASDAEITAVTDAVEPHVGNIASGGLTNDARPVVSGTAKDGVTLVRIYDGTTLLGEVAVTDGAWTFKSESDLSNGVHNFRIKAVDAAGNEGPYSPTWSVTVDTAAPNAPSITTVYDDVNAVTGNVADGKSTDDLRPTLSGGSAEAGSTVKIYDKGVLLGETIANSNGTWTFTPATDLAEGSHVFTVTSTDKAGNESVPSAGWTIHIDLSVPKTPEITQIWDDTNPGIGPVGKGETTNDTTPTLSGKADAGTVVKIFVNGTLLGETVATAAGTWTYTGFVSDGTHTFTVQSVNAVGTESALSEPFTIVVSTAVPGTPSITEVSDDVGTVTGKVDNGKTTDDTKPTISGTADANATVNIYDNGALLGQAKADGDGKWTFTPSTDLSEGGHAFTAKVVDGAGTEGQPSFPYTITVDTTAPEAPQFTSGYDAVGPVTGEFGDGAIINDGRPKLSGSGAEANAVVSIYQDGVLVGTVKADAGGQWSWRSPAALSDATYVFTATVTDAAGNVSAPSGAFTVTVDTVAPAAPKIEAVTDDVAPIEGNVVKGGFTNDTTPTISGSGAEANGIVRIYDGATLLGEVQADASGIWSYTPVNALGNGIHSFTVVGVDGAGNVSVRSEAYSVTVDTLAPNAPAITQVMDDVGSVTGAVASGKTTDDTKPTISGSGAEGGATVKIYDKGVLLGETTANANGTWSFTPTTDLSEGVHTFTATVTDQAGNESSASMPWSIEVDVTGPDARFKPVIKNASDDVLPDTGLVEDNGSTNDTTPRLNGVGGEPNGFIRIYSGGKLLGQVQADASGNWTFDVPTLTEGSHSFIATTVDAAGNEGESSAAFTLIVDTTAPTGADAKITEVMDDVDLHTGNIAHNGLTNDARPVISGTAEAGISLVRLYDGTTLLGEVKVTGGAWSFAVESDLANGVHNFRVKAVDAAGNEGPYSPSWTVTVDTTAPVAPTITQVLDDVGSVTGAVGSGKTTDDTKPTISGSGAEGGSIVKIYDGTTLLGQTIANANGTWSFTPTTDLSEGVHTFTATSTDAAGNEGTASMPWSIEVDLTGPDASFKPKILNASDDVLPNTGLLTNGEFTNDTTPRLNGDGAEANGLIRIYSEGKLLGTVQADKDGNWSFDVPTLSEGKHDFIATTVDAAGNEGTSSEVFSLTVDTKAPVASDAEITAVTDAVEPHVGNIASGGLTNDARPVVSGTAKDGVTLVRIYDGTTLLGEVAVTDGAWTFKSESDLSNGVHNFRIKAVDAAGNEGPYSPTWAVTVDTAAPNAPSITTVYDDVNAVTGNVADGKSTDDLRPTLSGGSAEAGSTVKIYDKGVLIGETIANSNGTWTFTPATDLAEGSHVFTVTSTDKAGNESVPSAGWTIHIDLSVPKTPEITQIWDDTNPGIGPVGKGETTNDTTPTLSGKADAGTVVKIFVNGTLLGETVATAAGTWTYTGFVSDGTHTFTVQSVNAVGTESALSEPFTIVVSTAVPGTPSITEVSDDVGTVTGVVGNGKPTDDVRPEIKGTADANATINIYDNGSFIGKATADADGNWKFTPTTDLTEGNHALTAKMVDGAGVEGQPSFPYNIVIDTTAPDAPRFTVGYDGVGPVIGEFGDGAIINDNRPKLSGAGAEPNAMVSIYQGGTLVATVRADAGGQWSWKATDAIADGTYTFTAKTTDAAGNVSAASDGFKVTVDTVAPNKPVIAQITDDQEPIVGNIAKDGFTNDTTPTLKGTGAEPNGLVRIYDGTTLIGEINADASGAWSYTPVNPLSNGPHTFTVVSVDAAGNVSAKSDEYKITVDTLAPASPSITNVLDDVGAVQGTVANGKTTDDTKPRLSGSGAESGSIVKIYDNGTLIGQTIANPNGTWVFTPTTDLKEGAHSFTVTATDQAGNESGESIAWVVTVDLTPPAKPEITAVFDDVAPGIGNVPNGTPTNDPTPTLAGKGDAGTTIRVYDGTVLLGEATVRADGTWAYTAPLLADGSHTFTVTSVDEAGNVSATSNSWSVVISTIPPEVPKIENLANNNGSELIQVANNGVTNDQDPLLTGTAQPNLVIRIYDNGALLGSTTADADGKWSFNFKTANVKLSEGYHSLTAAAVNELGFEGSQSFPRIVTIDITPPASPVIVSAADDVGSIINPAMPNGSLTDDTLPSFRGTTDAYHVIKLYRDGGILVGQATADGSGNWQIQLTEPLDSKTHNFYATATDPAGNTSINNSGIFKLTVDAIAPDAPKITRIVDNVPDHTGTITEGGLTNDPAPRVEGTSEANATINIYAGSLLVGTVKANSSGAWSMKLPEGLPDGSYVITATATDAAGNTGPASAGYTIVVDTRAPDVPQITHVVDDVPGHTGNIGNRQTTNDNLPLIVGKGEKGTTIAVYDNGNYLGTTTVDADGNWSYQVTRVLGDGTHKFTSTATDPAGNTTGSSNTLEIIIDTIAPSSPRIDDAYDSELGRTMSSGTFTKDTTPTLRGTAEAYSIVEIFDDVYGVIGTTTANGSGGWSFTPALGKELPDGVYNFKARATDLAGNTGPAMGTGFKLVIDTVPPVAPVIEQVIDDVAGGIVGNIPSNGLTNDQRPELKGTAEAGTTLTFFGGPNGTQNLGTMTVPANGQWSWTVPSSLSNGEHKLVVRSVDAAGNETYTKAPYVITVDASAPSTPSLTSVYDSTQPVVGNISSNGWTNETKPTFQGTAEAGSTLTIIHNNVEVGTVLVGPDGKWTWKPTTDLKDGVNNFNFKATDAAGNTSGSTSTFTMNVDTVPPVAPEITRIYDNVNPIQGDVPKDGYTNDATPTIYVTAEAYSTVIIYDNGVEVARYTLGNTTSWNWTPSQNISEGDHVYTVKQIDRAGQESPLSEPWKIIVDLLAPPAPTILQVWDDVDLYTGAIGQGKLTNDDTPTVSGTGVAGTKITVYANGNAVGTVIVGADNKWSLTTNKLGQGTVLLTAKAEDQAGNQSATSNSWSISVDTVAPNGGTGSNTEFYMDTYQDISKGYFEITRSIPVDQFGVKAVAMYNGQIVATADVDPATGRYTLKVPFADDNGWNTYQFGLLDEAGNIMYYRNKFYEYNYTSALGNQYHSDVLQRDFYIINSTEKAPPPVIDFMLDLVGTVREFGYNNYATDATGFTLTGHAKYGAGVSGATVQLYVDGNLVGTAYPSSYSGRWNYNVTGLTEGPHVFTATYTLDGVVSTVSQPFTVTVDLTPPDIPVIVEVVADEGLYAGKVENGGITNDKTVQLKGTTEPFATVRIYNGSSQIGEAKADASGNWVYTTNALSDGTHTFRTLGVDKVGNLGTLDLTKPGYVITVDTQPPAAPAINDALDDVGSVTGSVKSDGVTDDTKPLLQGTAEYGSTVRIYGTDGKTIIGTAVADATTGKWTFQIPTDLAEGKHTFTAEAVDKAGNIGPKSAAFNITVDTTAPDTPKITRVVDDVAPKLDDLVDGSSTNDTRPTFYGTAEANSTVRVYVGGVEIGTAKADASGNWNFTPAADKALTEGTHVVTFKAMDAAGNLSTTAASFTVKVDLTAPAKPQIDQIIDAVGLETGPVSNNGTTDDSRPTFKGKGEAGGTVSIMANGKLLGTTIVEADGTWSFKPTAAMTVEAHTITVTVADAAGNVSVASDAWKITIIRPAGGEPQGFSADMPDSGDMHSFSARSAHSDQQADDWNEPQAHAAPMSLDTSALLAELDVQDGQNYGEGGYDAEAYDDQSVLAGLIDLAQASSDTSGQAEQPAEEADVTQLIQDALTEPAPQESIDLSALPEEQAPAAGTTEPVTETQPVAVPEPAPVNTGDLDLERLLQQTSTYI